MKNAVMRLYNGFAKTKTALVALALLVYFALVVYGGGSLWEWLRFVLTALVYLLGPGLLAGRLLGLQKRIPGLAGPASLMLGTGFFAALFCVCQRLGLLVVLYILPPLLTLIWLALCLGSASGRGAARQRLGGLAPLRLRPHAWLLVLLWAFLVLVYAFAGPVKNAWPSAVGDVLLNHDLLWNAGNAESFKLAFPPEDIRFDGVRLHYHYLTELLAGALSQVTGIHSWNIIGFYMQPLSLLALVVCVYRFGTAVWQGQGLVKPVLFTYSLFLFSCTSLWKILPNGLSVFWNSHITHLVTNVNSVTTSVVFLSIFTGLFVLASRKKYRVGMLHHALLVAAFFLLTFSKGPLAGLVLVAVALTLLVGLPLKQTGWRGLVLCAVLVGIFVAVYTAMFASGANDSMALSYYGTLEKGYFYNILQRFNQTSLGGTEGGRILFCVLLYVVQAFLMAPAAFPLYLRGVGRDVRRFTELTPLRLLANAVAVGGFLAFFLFNHPAMSQVYFAFGGLFFVYLLAVDNIGLLRLPQKGLRGLRPALQRVFVAAVAVLAAVGLVTTAFLYTHLLGSGARQLLRNLGVTEKYPYDVVMNADDEAAALWLRENTAQDAVFATNRIHTGGRLEGISNLYSALSGRQAFMEGFQYAKTNMGVPEFEIVRRLEVNTALFNEDTPPGDVAALMRENGIGYLLFTTQMAAQFEEYHAAAGAQLAGLTLVFESDTVYIWRLDEG